MNFLKSLGGLVGANAATGGLPYVLDAPPSSSSSSSSAGDPSSAGTECGAFLLFPGHAKSDASLAVSIFKSRDAASPPSQNALRRIKTLRHPNVLAFLDGVETPNHGPVILVTERVTPLPQFLDELRRQSADHPDAYTQSVAWGLRSILLALQFLTVDCKLLHGRVSPQSVFVTKGGDWKLAGFELTGELSSDRGGPTSHFTSYESMWADPQYKSPEWQRRDWQAIAKAPTYGVDMFAFAALVYYVFNDSTLRASDLASATNIPHALRMPYRKAVDQDATKRPSPVKVLHASFFETPFIKRMDFVENLAVKTPEEKVEFYKDLGANLATLPPLFAVYKVLPALKGVVEFGAASGGGKNAHSGVLKLDPSASHMLPAMVQIGSSLAPEEFKDQVLPVIIKLFSCNDRAVRVQLLQMMEKFSVHLDAKLVNSAVIFDNLCSGFTDAAPVLRELTVKSMLHIADKLSDANLNTRVMKYFAKLQTDPEPAIRTNTTICLGRIAPKLNEATRPKVLFPAFSRALRDPFPHARLAGLRSLTACEEFFTPQGMASSIVPVLAPLLLDVSVSVREQASLSMELFMKKVMDEAAQMKIREAQQAQEQKLRQENGSGGGADAVGGAAPSASATQSSVSVTGSGSSYAASLTSWAASAVATNVSKIVGAGAASPTPPTSAYGVSQQQQKPTHSASSSSFTAPAASSSSSAFAAAADDFGADDDAWGDDNELDGFGSPKAPVRSSFGSSSASASASRVGSSGSSSMKLTTARGSSSSSTTSAFAMAPTDSAWGDDNWGGDDDLGFGEATAAAASKPAASSLRVGATSFSSSLQVGNAGLRTSSFGTGTTTTAPAATSSLFSTPTPAALASGGASSVRKPVSERMAEAKAKRESLGAMKLDASKKKGDEWDNWDF